MKGLFIFFLFASSSVSIRIDVPQMLVELSVNIVDFEFVFKEFVCCFLIFGVQIDCNLTSSYNKIMFINLRTMCVIIIC